MQSGPPRLCSVAIRRIDLSQDGSRSVGDSTSAMVIHSEYQDHTAVVAIANTMKPRKGNMSNFELNQPQTSPQSVQIFIYNISRHGLPKPGYFQHAFEDAPSQN